MNVSGTISLTAHKTKIEPRFSVRKAQLILSTLQVAVNSENIDFIFTVI